MSVEMHKAIALLHTARRLIRGTTTDEAMTFLADSEVFLVDAGHKPRYDLSTDVEHMLVASTAHVTQETCNNWLPDADMPAFEKADYGWFIYVGNADPADMPEDLRAVIAKARNFGCQWLMLDRDGNTLDGLETYDW